MCVFSFSHLDIEFGFVSICKVKGICPESIDRLKYLCFSYANGHCTLDLKICLWQCWALCSNGVSSDLVRCLFLPSSWDGNTQCVVFRVMSAITLFDFTCVLKSICSRLMRHLFLIKILFKNTLLILMTCLWLIVSICPSLSWGYFTEAAFSRPFPNAGVPLAVATPCRSQGTEPSYQFPWENHSSLKLKSTLKNNYSSSHWQKPNG